MELVVKKFREAGLRLKIAGRPFAGISGPGIFQMTIRDEGKWKRYAEYFEIFRGSKDNRVEVLAVDARRNQLVLLVKEARRKFTVAERVDGKLVDRVRSTRGALRKYLVGKDESRLFLCELSAGNVPKVADAHRALKPPAVVEAEKRGMKVRRQGEWFFVEEAEENVRVLLAPPAIVRKNTPLGRALGLRRNPHVADALVDLGEERYLAQGRVRHRDHKTLVFRRWVRVYRNNELVNPRNGISGWVD
jgi:hypothetical protein